MTGLWVQPQYRLKGLGTLLAQMCIDIAHKWGYGLLLASDVRGNVPREKLFNKSNWQKIDSFTNPRTDNEVELYSLLLEESATDTAIGFKL